MKRRQPILLCPTLDAKRAALVHLYAAGFSWCESGRPFEHDMTEIVSWHEDRTGASHHIYIQRTRPQAFRFATQGDIDDAPDAFTLVNSVAQFISYSRR